VGKKGRDGKKTAGEGRHCFWEIKKRTPSPAGNIPIAPVVPKLSKPCHIVIGSPPSKQNYAYFYVKKSLTLIFSWHPSTAETTHSVFAQTAAASQIGTDSLKIERNHQTTTTSKFALGDGKSKRRGPLKRQEATSSLTKRKLR